MAKVRQARRIVLDVDVATSARLGRVRQQDTGPEEKVRSLLHREGLRFRKRNRDLPGSPDAANRRKRWAVFVNGCFWHKHRRCRKASVPKRNRAFWLAKFENNRRRDRRALRALAAMKFRCVVVWQCEVEKSHKGVVRRFQRLLPGR